MTDLEKNKLSEENINENEVKDTVEEVTPEEEYKKSLKRRKKILLGGLISLVGVEIIIAVMLGYKMQADNLYNRVLREYEMRSYGQIQLTKGVYEGETDFGYFYGKGYFLFETGTKYTGEWEKNQLKGNGTLHVPNEGIYEGDFSSSQKNGKGTFTWDDGAEYVGEWKNDRMCGQGTYMTSDGVNFSGTFKDNTFQDGTCKYKNDTGSYNLTYKSGIIDKASIHILEWELCEWNI